MRAGRAVEQHTPLLTVRLIERRVNGNDDALSRPHRRFASRAFKAFSKREMVGCDANYEPDTGPLPTSSYWMGSPRKRLVLFSVLVTARHPKHALPRHTEALI